MSIEWLASVPLTCVTKLVLPHYDTDGSVASRFLFFSVFHFACFISWKVTVGGRIRGGGVVSE